MLRNRIMGSPSERPNLVVLSRPLSGARFVFEDGDELFIGSDPSCRFYLNLPQVSPFHARLRVERDALAVFDTSSMTGVWVNDDRVQDNARVRSGDIVWLGPPGDETSLMLQYWHPPEGIDVVERPAKGPDDSDVLQRTMIDAAPPDLDASPATEVMRVVDVEVETQSLPIVDDDSGTEAMTVIDVDPPTEVMAVLPQEPEPIEIVDESTLVDAPQVAAAARSALAETVSAPIDFESTMTVQRPVIPEAPPSRPAPVPPVEATMMMGAPTVPAVPPAPPAPPPPAPPPPAPPPPAAVAPPVAAPRPAPAPAPAPPKPAPVVAKPAPPPARPPAPKPAAPAPAPRRAAPVPAPAMETVALPEVAPAPRAPSSSSKAPLFAGLGLVALLVLGGGAWFALKSGKPADPAPPATVAAVTPGQPPATVSGAVNPGTTGPVEPAPIEEVETVVPGAPVTMAPVPGQAPPATLPTLPQTNVPPTAPPASTAAAPPNAGPAQVASAALARGDAALAAGQYDEALAAFDEALRADPQSRAGAGRTAATALKKTFVPTASKFVGRPKKGVPPGFEGGVADPAYQGRIEWEFTPARVKPGDPLSIRAFLVNEGTKEITLDKVELSTIVDGSRNAMPGAGGRKVAPRQRVMLGEVSSTWKDGVRAWILEARAVSKREDAYWSRVVWR